MLDGFQGKLSLANVFFWGSAYVRNENANTRFLMLGADDVDAGTLDRAGSGGQVSMLNSAQYVEGQGYIALPTVGSSDAAFIKTMLEDLRNEPTETGNSAVSALAAGVTDVQIYAVGIENAVVGLKVSSNGTVAPPPVSPAAGITCSSIGFADQSGIGQLVHRSGHPDAYRAGERRRRLHRERQLLLRLHQTLHGDFQPLHLLLDRRRRRHLHSDRGGDRFAEPLGHFGGSDGDGRQHGYASSPCFGNRSGIRAASVAQGRCGRGR